MNSAIIGFAMAGAQVLAGLTLAAWAVRNVNAHNSATSLLDRIAVSVIGGGAVMAVLGVAFSHAPVVVDATATIITHEPGRLRFELHAFKPKDRDVCDYLSSEAYVLAGGAILEVPFVYENDPVPGNTKPAGYINFGTLRLTYPETLIVEGAQIRAHHRCAWWMPVTNTDMGPFAVPKAGALPQPNSSGKAVEP